MRYRVGLTGVTVMCLIAACPAAARAQWHWDPKQGWVDERPVAVKEPAPPAFLPRYREQPQKAPLGTPAGDYYAAYLAYEADLFPTAARAFGRLAEAYRDEAAGPPPGLSARALFMRGESLYQGEEYIDAYRTFDEMLTKYPGGPNYRLALQREFEIAHLYLRGRRRYVLGLPLRRGDGLALEILERVRNQDPRGPLADACLATLGNYSYGKGDYKEAEVHYEALLREHPDSPFAAQAMYRVAHGQFIRQQGPDYDAGLLRRARAGFQRFLRLYPAAPEAPRAQAYLREVEARLARAHLENGRFYESRGRPASALVYYRRVLASFPETAAAAEAEHRIRRITEGGVTGRAGPPPAAPASDAGEAP